MYKQFFKRPFDFFAALFGLLLLSPVFIIVAIALFIANQSKPFFFQQRPGKHGKIFKVIKFRSMNDKKDGEGNLLPDADRLTSVGKVVRKTSLDEIPQLLNVLKREMILVDTWLLLENYESSVGMKAQDNLIRIGSGWFIFCKFVRNKR